MLVSQVFRQQIDDLFAVVGPMLSTLLMFDDAAADFPVGCRQNTVDPASDRAASSNSEMPDNRSSYPEPLTSDLDFFR